MINNPQTDSQATDADKDSDVATTADVQADAKPGKTKAKAEDAEDAEEKVVTKTLKSGTKVTGPASVIAKLK